MLSAEEWEIIRLSLKVAAWSVAVSLPVGYLIAYRLARSHSIGSTVLDVLVTLPLVLPPVVTGFALLVFFGRNGPGGEFLERALGVTLIFRWTGAALAAAVMSLPLMVRVMRVAIASVDARLTGAARTLGAGPWRAFATITLPLSLPGIFGAIILGFAKALGEFGATITFVSNIPGETRTIPLAIYNLLQTPSGEAGAWRLCIVSVAVSVVAIVATELLSRRMRQPL